MGTIITVVSSREINVNLSFNEWATVIKRQQMIGNEMYQFHFKSGIINEMFTQFYFNCEVDI